MTRTTSHLIGESVRRPTPGWSKGRVTSIDTTASPDLVTVSGRQMPIYVAGVTVGDVVLWWNDPLEPFAIGPAIDT